MKTFFYYDGLELIFDKSVDESLNSQGKYCGLVIYILRLMDLAKVYDILRGAYVRMFKESNNSSHI